MLIKFIVCIYKRILKTEMQNFEFSVVRSVPVKSVLNQILKF
jgi:hypothetical protein